MNSESKFDFFELKTAKDLFRKLEGDLAALEKSGQDSCVAFNFFVTAEHLPEWLSPCPINKKDHAIINIVSHISNGAKHFKIRDKKHQSVTGTEKYRYLEEGYYEQGYYYEPLLIHLSLKEEKELGMRTIDAVTLGKKVVDFWRPYIPKP
jgi:hypothetical protein